MQLLSRVCLGKTHINMRVDEIMAMGVRKCHLCDEPVINKYCENIDCAVNRRDEKVSVSYMETDEEYVLRVMNEKAAKWEDLDRAVFALYFDTDGYAHPDDPDRLVKIGELVASKLSYLQKFKDG
jgi:hypothetical protein